ncbi:NTP transferase domain-containing protein [Pendulispora albinea]|uniref:Nucleotidyltransferase family protein n=1 Tax=Pendulispora albinea TaxID=2741071 RepID=A0ABZ2M3D7_9BACT
MSSAHKSRAVHAVILAAGGSRRLGRPKQLVELGGVSLLRRAVDVAQAADVASVTVVLGAREEDMVAELSGLSVRAVHNPDWEAGMGSSIRCGARALGPLAEDEAMLFLLCDQLRLTTAHLDAMVATFRASEARAIIVASGYAGTAGVPVLFSTAFVEELTHLADSEGGKHLLARHAPHVRVVPLPDGERDLDTAEDLRLLRARANEDD